MQRRQSAKKARIGHGRRRKTALGLAKARCDEEDEKTDEEDDAAAIRMNWARTLRSQLEARPDFFESAETTLTLSGAIKRGKTAYATLKIHEDNNLEMRQIFTLRYEAKANAGQPVGTYELLKTTVGQFARLCCVKQTVRAENLWNEMHLYGLLTDMGAVRALVQYFQLRGMHITTSSKAFHVRTLCNSAKIYISGGEGNGNLVLRRRMTETGHYLLSVMSVEKTEGRRLSRVPRTVED